MFPVVMDPVEFELAHRRPLRRSLVACVQMSVRAEACVQKSRPRPYRAPAGTAAPDHEVARRVASPWARGVVGRRPLCNNAAAFSVDTRAATERPARTHRRGFAPGPPVGSSDDNQERTVDGH
ncbi:hypothetical protein FM106_25835 [Brachybacterium faecium]|nr:hypothetical protein FM106_25835 [Brachybacterium faecium]